MQTAKESTKKSNKKSSGAKRQAPGKKAGSKATTTQVEKKVLHFSKPNIELAKELVRQGLSHKQIARKLNEYFVTKVRHKRITNRTVANLIASERTYSDSDSRHNDTAAANIAPKVLADVVTANIPATDSDIQAILKCNLPEDLKLKCIECMTR